MEIRLDKGNVFEHISEAELNSLQGRMEDCSDALLEKTCKGNDYLGWVNLPGKIKAEEIIAIKNAAERFLDESEVVVIIGIGGSYLGARAVIDALTHNFSCIQSQKARKHPLILFAGQNLSEDYLSDLLEILDKKDYSIVVISKSGTTTEPAIAFRILEQHIEDKYGKDISKRRIIAITDKARGSLKKLAGKTGYETFVIPDDVGGRFSVLTPVGLLPIAIAGLDIGELLEGAKEMSAAIKGNSSFEKNIAFYYAAIRYLLFNKGKVIEMFVNYNPSLHYFTEWWKQLYGESEGKQGKGIFPAGADLTTDLHSMGQLMQDGVRNIFETILWVEKPRKELTVPEDKANYDELNYIAGKRINEVNEKAMLGTEQAHKAGGLPVIKISIPELNERNLGALIYFFEYACALSGLLLDVNPFDQPGVEEYKKNMFKLLGK
jgi:glucose-6-phosphate isomerase